MIFKNIYKDNDYAELLRLRLTNVTSKNVYFRKMCLEMGHLTCVISNLYFVAIYFLTHSMVQSPS